ncbi:MAG: 3-keto-5-aminohexanoate cleavage protein [Hyphomicrobiales bacterium]|nr:3-keto-5-aminohexanoate cleavage protein [Hyphomicrobiales bacterium]OQW82989.1 MAG: 3-keto-5-aminohexanoate cleavage protein [Proteobacteria bacterium ST_bin15]
MSRSVWLECALNGPWGRDLQPAIPVTADEIVEAGIAAHGEGAAILHFHAYDEVTGRQRDDAAIYAPIIERLRRATGAIVYPTLPIAGSTLSGPGGSAVERFSHVEALAKMGLIEWAVVDPGSVNFARRDAAGHHMPGFIYANPDDHIRRGLELAALYRFHPSFAIYEPGFTRLGAHVARLVPAPQAIYRFMFSEQFAWGFPPTAYALDAHLALLSDEAAGAPWMIAGLGVDLVELIAMAVESGGHVRAGLEDARFGTPMDNGVLTAIAAREIARAGGALATPAIIRAALALT